MPQCDFCGKSKRGFNPVHFLKPQKLRRWADDDSSRWHAEIFEGVFVPTKICDYDPNRPRGLIRCRACHDLHECMFIAQYNFVPATKPARNKNARLKPNPNRSPSTDSDHMSFSPWREKWGPVRTPSEQSPLPFDPSARGSLPVPPATLPTHPTFVKQEASRSPSGKRSRYHYHRKGR